MKTMPLVFLWLGLLAVFGCTQRALDREQAAHLIQAQLFHSEDWKFRRFQGVTGITATADGRSAAVEFKYAFPPPGGEEWKEKSFLAKVEVRLYDDGWRIEGTPVTTQVFSGGMGASLPLEIALAESEARLIEAQQERHGHPPPTVISLEEARAWSDSQGPTPLPVPDEPTGGTIRMRGKTIPIGAGK